MTTVLAAGSGEARRRPISSSSRASQLANARAATASAAKRVGLARSIPVSISSATTALPHRASAASLAAMRRTLSSGDGEVWDMMSPFVRLLPSIGKRSEPDARRAAKSALG